MLEVVGSSNRGRWYEYACANMIIVYDGAATRMIEYTKMMHTYIYILHTPPLKIRVLNLDRMA